MFDKFIMLLDLFIDAIRWALRVIKRVNSVDAVKDILDEGLNWADVLWLTFMRVIQVFDLPPIAMLLGTGESPALILASLSAVFFVGGLIFGMLKKDAAAIKQEQTGDLQKILEDKHKEHPDDQTIKDVLKQLQENPANLVNDLQSWPNKTINELPLITDPHTSIGYKITLTQKISGAVQLSTTTQHYPPARHELNVQNGGDEESGLLGVANSTPERSFLQRVTKIVYKICDSYPGKIFLNLWGTTPMVLWANPILGWGFSTLYAGPDAANNTDNLHLLPAAVYGPVAFIITYTGLKIASYRLQPEKTKEDLRKEKEDEKELQRIKLAEVLFKKTVTHKCNMQILENLLSLNASAQRTDISSLPPAKRVKPPVATTGQYTQSTWLETSIPIAIKLSGSSIIANFGAWEGSNVAGLIELALKNSQLADDLINKSLQTRIMAFATNLIGAPSTMFFASDQQYQRQKLTARAKQILDTLINDGTQQTLFQSITASQDTLASNRQTIKDLKADMRSMIVASNKKAEDYIPKIKIMKDFTDLKDEFTRSFIEKVDRAITLYGRMGGGIYWYRFYVLYLFNNQANHWHFGGASIVGALLTIASYINFSCGDNFEFKKQLVNGLFEVADFVLKQHIELSRKYIEVLQHKHAELKTDEMENRRLRAYTVLADESTPLLGIN